MKQYNVIVEALTTLKTLLSQIHGQCRRTCPGDICTQNELQSLVVLRAIPFSKVPQGGGTWKLFIMRG